MCPQNVLFCINIKRFRSIWESRILHRFAWNLFGEWFNVIHCNFKDNRNFFFFAFKSMPTNNLQTHVYVCELKRNSLDILDVQQKQQWRLNERQSCWITQTWRACIPSRLRSLIHPIAFDSVHLSISFMFVRKYECLVFANLLLELVLVENCLCISLLALSFLFLHSYVLCMHAQMQGIQLDFGEVVLFDIVIVFQWTTKSL